MSGNAKRRRPRPEKRQVQVRTSCGYSHWWWPSPPSPGQHCICGETAWPSEELAEAHRREVVEPMERRFFFGDGAKL